MADQMAALLLPVLGVIVLAILFMGVAVLFTKNNNE
jgi:hypothetical protein